MLIHIHSAPSTPPPPPPRKSKDFRQLGLLPPPWLFWLRALLLSVALGGGLYAPPLAAQTTCSPTDVAVTGVIIDSTDTAGRTALAGDCTILLGLMDTLRGTASLNWATTLSMASWDGLTVPGSITGGRVADLSLPTKELTGSIPDLSALTSLISLNLANNDLSGSLTASHFPPSLTSLSLHHNDFTGSIPDLSALTSLISLNLANNDLSGSLTASHFPPSLTHLYLHTNQLSGTIPDLSALTSLTSLSLHHNDFTGSIPDLSALTILDTLHLNNNDLSGSLTASHFPTSLIQLYLGANDFTGSIPDLSALTTLEFLSIRITQLSGTIPDLSALTTLRLLHLDNNDLSGSLTASHFPPSLTSLSLHHNDFTGSIPDLSALTILDTLHLSGNDLSGSLTASHFPPSLIYLYLHNNQLSGTIPDLSALTSLLQLYLHTNQLTGSLTASHFPPSLTHLYLHTNQLSGTIPDLSALTSLTQLGLRNNQLTGSLTASHFPPSLIHLYLSTNQLSGTIPDLSALSSLRWLWLHTNQLTGNLNGLSSLNLWALYLHTNQLSGAIPAFPNALSHFRLSLYGNAGLYGYPAALNSRTLLRLLAPGTGAAVCLPSTMGGTDCTVPTLVDNLRVQASPAQLVFTWAPNPADPAPTGYAAQYWDPTAGRWIDAAVTGTTATITGLTPGVEYSFLVWTTATATATPPDPHPVQTTPRLYYVVTLPLLAPPTGLSVTAGTARLTLGWTAPAGTVTGYDVHYKTAAAADRLATSPTDPTTGWVAATRSGTTPSQTITGLTPGTAYAVRVRAKNADGTGAWATGQGTPSGGGDGLVVIMPDRVDLDEGGTSGSYTVVLTAAPTGDVTVTARSAEPEHAQVQANGGPLGASVALRFMPSNYNQAQTVTVVPHTADADNEDEFFVISHTVNGPGVYANISAPDVTVLVDDDEPVGGGGSGSGSGGGGGGGGGSRVRDTHGNSPARATVVPLTPQRRTLTRSGHLVSRTDRDYFRLDLPEPGILWVESRGRTDTRGRLFDAESTLLATDDTSGTGQNFALATAVARGVHYIAVDSTQRATGTYTLAIDYQPGVLENPAAASAQSGIGIVSGWVCAADTVTVEVVPATGPPSRLAAASGTARADTAAVCGHSATGFGLLLNWNLLGDGPHRVRVLVDGVPLATAPVTVTTLGAEYRTGLSGTYALTDFPAPGETTPVVWSEPQQNFVLATGTVVRGATDRRGEAGVAHLDNPAPGSPQSGLGVVSGWACEADRVAVVLTPEGGAPGPPIAAASGTARADTAAVCGHSATGFGLLLNWNLLGDGEHVVELLVDGVAVAQSTVRVTTLGEEYVVGLRGTYTLAGFPTPEETVTIAWQERQQNFVLVDGP